MRASVLLILWSLMTIPVLAGEKTPVEKLCAGYERKQAMLERRLKIGVRSWEKNKLNEQLRALAADRAKYCKQVSKPSAGARP